MGEEEAGKKGESSRDIGCGGGGGLREGERK